MIYIASSVKHVGKIKEDIFIRDQIRLKDVKCEIATLQDIVSESLPDDIVILKSIWGYHLEFEKFIIQIKSLKEKGLKLVNPYEVVMWNIDKSRYLEDVRQDINTIPTQKLNLNENDTREVLSKKLQTISSYLSQEELVVKPAISASGYATYIYKTTCPDKTVLQKIIDHNSIEYLVQPYRKSVLNGELSVVIIGGETMYGISRYPGIFTDNKSTEYIPIENLPNQVIQLAEKTLVFLLKKFGYQPHILRLDVIGNVNLGFEVLELELIDPDLFFRKIPIAQSGRASTLLVEKVLSQYCLLM